MSLLFRELLTPGRPRGSHFALPAFSAVFGAHGMGQDTILRNLALLNVLWDGGEMAIDRRSKPSFVLRARRLTFGLMVQPEALRGSCSAPTRCWNVPARCRAAPASSRAS